MILSFIFGLLAVLVLIPLAIMVWHWMLRELDARSGVVWKASYDKMFSDPLALAVYHGCRLLAVGLIIAALFGKFL